MTALDWELILRLSIAFGLSGVVGFERGSMRQPAGLRTHILVGVGSASFMLAGIYGFGGFSGAGSFDPSRVGAGVVTGIGFLGAGTIWRSQSSVHGLTSASSIWITAAIGMLAAGGLYALAVFATIIATLTLRLLWTPSRRLEQGRLNLRGGHQRSNAIDAPEGESDQPDDT